MSLDQLIGGGSQGSEAVSKDGIDDYTEIKYLCMGMWNSAGLSENAVEGWLAAI